MTKKYNYNNSLKKNQYEIRTNEEIQKIINSYPSHYSKKDFRGEGANNLKKILTRKETERDGLVFGTYGRLKKYQNGKLQCSICKKFKLEEDFPTDNNVKSNKKRSNCKVCEVKRYQNYLNGMSSIKKEKMYKERYANLTKAQLEDKRERDRKYRESLRNN